MTISRVNGAGWAVNDKLSSAQANGLDLNTTYALDKRSGQTDTLQSSVTITGGVGSISVNRAAGIVANAAGAIVAQASNCIQLNLAGACQPGVAGGFTNLVTGGVKTTGAGLSITDAGWPSFQSTRTFQKALPLLYPQVASGWGLNANGSYLTGPNSTTAQWIHLTGLLNGATFNGAVITRFTPIAHSGSSYTAAAVEAYRMDLFGTLTLQSMISTTSVSLAKVVGAVASNDTIAFDQNNVIDLTNYTYLMKITDENGADALAGTRYHGPSAIFSNITQFRTF